MQTPSMSPADGDNEADALIAMEKVEKIKREGISIDNGTPYSHNSTYGGRMNAFIPRRIRSNRTWVGVLIFLVMIVVIELIGRYF